MSGAGPITQFDSDGYFASVRLRAEGLRADGLDRLQDGAPDGPVRADGRRRRADGRERLRARHRRRLASGSARRSRPGIGGLQSFQDCHTQLRDRGPDRVNPFSIPAIIPNLGAGWLSIELGTRGPLSAPCTACAASNMAIGEGMDAIRLGRADVMFCGGTEAPGHPGRHRRLRRDAGALAAQRRPGAREPAVRHRARRLRDGRGRRGARARGARAGEGARREDLRRARRLRRLLRRAAHHRARPDRRPPGPGDADGARRRGHRRRATSTTSTRTARRRRSATPARPA